MPNPAPITVASDDPSADEIPLGFQATSFKTGIKPSGLSDLALIRSERPCRAVGLFTTNRLAAAPVIASRRRLPSESVRGLVINAGNANAATGPKGLEDSEATAKTYADLLGCESGQVLVASTGIIGVPLPIDRLLSGIMEAYPTLTSKPFGFLGAADAIMTTDTRIKVKCRSLTLGDGRTVRILGIAKGAAMIAPQMATMLGFLLTDADMPLELLNPALRRAVDRSFHRISVEGHRSTNDAVILLANGASATLEVPEDRERFAQALEEVCIDLARMIPDDGEGASHLIEIGVRNARNEAQAERIARAIAESPLVKTAIAGNDPNWGRIISAAGYADDAFDPERARLTLNDVPIFQRGVPSHFDPETLSRSLAAQRLVRIDLDLEPDHPSPRHCRFWTCDLTTEYVRINSEYTT